MLGGAIADDGGVLGAAGALGDGVLWGDRVKIAAKRAGVIGHRRTIDSTGVADSVLTQDTITLIRSGVRRCVGLLAAAVELLGVVAGVSVEAGALGEELAQQPVADAGCVALAVHARQVQQHREPGPLVYRHTGLLRSGERGLALTPEKSASMRK